MLPLLETILTEFGARHAGTGNTAPLVHEMVPVGGNGAGGTLVVEAVNLTDRTEKSIRLKSISPIELKNLSL
jgi:hypothetical protein